MRRAGQVSLEYMIIVAIVVAFILPVWAYLTSVQVQTGMELSISYARNAAAQLTDAADLVYSQGPPARINVQVYIPGNVAYINITNSTVNFGIRKPSGISHVFDVSRAQLNGTLPASEGTYWVTVEAQDSLVQIGLAEQ